MSNHKSYEENLWLGTISWRTIESTPGILTFSARGVIIWMGKTIAKFSLHLTRMTHCRCITRKCFVPNTVPRNSGAFQSNRWKPGSQELNQSALCHLAMNSNPSFQEDKKEMRLLKEWLIPKSLWGYLDCTIFTAKFQSQEISSSLLLDPSILTALTS